MSEPTTLLPAEQKVLSVSERIKANLPQIIKGHEIAMRALSAIREIVITTDEQREEAVSKLATVRKITERIHEYRTEITKPFDEVFDYLMSFERPLDDKGKDNEFAKAKAQITAYDQKKIDDKKKAEAEAEVLRQTANYKAELKAAVGRQLVDMMAGQKNTMISGMARWEKNLTLINFDAKEAEINLPGSPALKMEIYDACFNTNFNRKYILNEQATKEYIESLKTEYPYAKYNEEYKVMATELKNEYRAKMGSIKKQLIEAQANSEAEEKRKKEIEAKEEADRKKVADEQASATLNVESQKDMSMMEAEFIKQGTTQDLEAGPVKKEASFVNDGLWMKPLMDVVAHVATSGSVSTIRKKNGEYIDSVDWWLKKFAPLGKTVDGVVIRDAAKTIIREKTTE